MGIDVYLKWEGQTKEEADEQITGFSIGHGHVGYLRESYGSPLTATTELIPSQYWHEQNGEPIDPAVLRENLPAALEVCKKRYEGNPENTAMAVKSFEDFVALAEAKAAEGREVRIRISY